MLGQAVGRATRGWCRELPLAWELPATHWNLISASSRKWVSKSQRKKRSRLEGERRSSSERRGAAEQHGRHHWACAFPCPRLMKPSGPTPPEQPLLPHGTTTVWAIAPMASQASRRQDDADT